MSSILIFHHLAKRSPRTTNALLLSHQTTRSMGFQPRRTPPPSIAGVNLSPRAAPAATTTTAPPSPMTATVLGGGGGDASSPPNKKMGGQGSSPDWISPHHKDYYDKIDGSTMNHPHLLHGDPHMPIAQLNRGDGVVVLDGMRKGAPAREISDYRDLEHLPKILTETDNNDRSATGKEDEFLGDDLDREFGSNAAEVIRTHLYQFQIKQQQQQQQKDGSKKYSPLKDIEEAFRTIDRLTAAPGSTQDLALIRRSKTEMREFAKLGSIPKHVVDGENDDDFDSVPNDDVDDLFDDDDDDGGLDGEFGKTRRYDAESMFGKGASTSYPYGKPKPAASYHDDFPTEKSGAEDEKWMEELNKLIYEEQYTEMGLGELDDVRPVNIQQEDMEMYMKEKERTKKWNMMARENDKGGKDREEEEDVLLEMIKRGDDPNQEAFGPWGECTIKVDRVQKVERGGTTVRYRALLIGGNGNGAAGFGIGKALSPNDAIIKASRHCKRNVFYINRYLNSGLSYDIAGKHNSCRVALRAVRPDYGLHGHPLICEILKYAGITDATTKSHGNRNPYNVVYSTFKALMTHESLEDIAMKRGKKFLNLQRARRLGI